MSEQRLLFAFGKTHNDIALDVMRGFLGIALFVRGILFVADSSRIIALVQVGHMDYLAPALLLYAAILAHLFGGLLLALGLVTRIAALIQIPVLMGAVYIAFVQGGLFLPSQSLELTVLVLFILCILFVFGSGPLSLDRVVFREGRAAEVEARESDAAERFQKLASEWSEERRRLQLQPTESTKRRPEPVTDIRARVISLLRNVALIASAGVLFYFAVRSLPFEISLAEIGAIGGILFMVLGLFFFIFSWAFKEHESSEE